MDKSNYDDVIALAQTSEQNKVQIILNELYPNENVTFLILTLVMPNGFEIVYR
jgi:protein-tyrosine phosphatase